MLINRNLLIYVGILCLELHYIFQIGITLFLQNYALLHLGIFLIILNCISNIKKKDKCFRVHENNKMIHFKWIIGILIGIIITILSYKFWGKPAPLESLISISSGLVSIALALLAIILALFEKNETIEKEKEVRSMLGEIKTIVKDNIFPEVKKTNEYFKHLNKISLGKSQFTSKEKNYSTIFPKEKINQEQTSNENNRINKVYRRGDILLADLNNYSGNEIGGIFPVVVIQNEISNKYAPTINVVPIVNIISKAKLPTHVELNARETTLGEKGVILVEQLKTIDKRKVIEKKSHVSTEVLSEIDQALMIQLGLVDF